MTALIPWRLLAIAALCATLAGLGWVKGAAHVQNKWDAAVLKQSSTVAAVQQSQAEATIRVVTDYVDRVRIVREAGQTIVKEVPVYVPSTPDTCDLPGGFRLLHDAAARGDYLPPGAAGIADAAAAPPQDVAATVADNYATCHEIAEQLEALQDWVSQQRLNAMRTTSGN